MSESIEERVRKVTEARNKEKGKFDGRLHLEKKRGFQGYSITDKKPCYYGGINYHNIGK